MGSVYILDRHTQVAFLLTRVTGPGFHDFGLLSL